MSGSGGILGRRRGRGVGSEGGACVVRLIDGGSKAFFGFCFAMIIACRFHVFFVVTSGSWGCFAASC